MTHTPGPWRVDLERDDFEIAIVGRPIWPCNRYGVAGEWEVAQVEVLNDRDDETRANARLIAAAPKLLAALKHLVAYAEAANDPDWFPEEAERIAVARAVIAEAEGNSASTSSGGEP